ncbi:MAG: hypothetical protein HFACDABA_02298 [Anaerolineales bacterium]|nr:hypothetical protein [Anaerolineales bacterium]
MPIHPFLFAVYIVVALYANNTTQVPPAHVMRPLIFFLLLAACLFWLFNWRSKDRQYSAYATSWTMLWLALFGHLYQAVNLAILASTGRAANEIIILFVWTLVMGLLGTPQAWKNIRNKKLINDVLTAIAVGAAIFPFFTTTNALYQNQRGAELVDAWQAKQPRIQIHAEGNFPDIYYIILDGYARADVLQDMYGFDNSAFVSALTQRGFLVANQSRSNYMQTALSLASSLNLEYVNFLSDAGGNNRSPAYQLLEDSRLRVTLEDAGYRTVNIASPALFTQFRSYDQYTAPGNASLTEFEKLLISTTPLGTLAANTDLLIPGYQSHRVYTLYSFEALSAVASSPGPKFVFTHVVGPHPPFVFDAQGGPVQSDQPYVMSDASGFPGTRDEYLTGYLGEMQYINQLVLQTVDSILANSPRPPVIVIQGDHGPGAFTNLFLIEEACQRERGSILNAYYFPDKNYAALSPDITPVNTFRVILNRYFDAALPLLENRTYFSYWDAPYNFVDVTDRMDASCNR